MPVLIFLSGGNVCYKSIDQSVRHFEFPLSERPGLGLEVKELELAKVPFKGTRSMRRLRHEDGRVAAW